jgi:hypothetical protein
MLVFAHEFLPVPSLSIKPVSRYYRIAFFLPIARHPPERLLGLCDCTVQTSKQACLDNKTHCHCFNNQEDSLNVAKGIVL